MTFPSRMKFGIFMAPFHPLGENPTLALERDLETISWLDHLGFDEAWIGEHHSAGWETISSPEVFIGVAAERTKFIKLGTGVLSLPYHHPLMVADRMVLLDHLTRGRVMMGVGPGALITDAYMLGIDPTTQRRRMDESLGVIMRLLTETEPITYKSEWFTLNEARLNLKPYTQPHFPVAVASAVSPSGMVLAGKHGASVLSLSLVRDGSISSNLGQFWDIAEESASQHGKLMRREEWRLVMPVHLADSRQEAVDQARSAAGRFQRDYFENTLGLGGDLEADSSVDEIIDAMVDQGAWCVGTPDDLIATMERLDQESGGYGGLLIQAGEWGTREQVLRSYELVARYVMPRFQGSLDSLSASQAWASESREGLTALRDQAIDRANRDYQQHR